MFLLVKWYLDLVTDDGTALWAYSARLRWGALRLSYASVCRSVPGARLDEAATIRGVVAPRLDWLCQMPRARATVRWGDSTYVGLGYVESLRLTIPPGRPPFRTLRWGRHLSDRHALVWIEWEGGDPQRWVWLDGSEQRDARLTADGIAALDRGCELRLGSSRDLCDRPVVGSLARFLPAVARRAAGPLGSMREHKQLSRSSLLAPGQAPDLGWAIHEEVTW